MSIAAAKAGAQDAEAFALGCARFIEDKLFKTTLAPEEVAAIFVEPVQGEGGYVVAPTVFMQELRRICDKYGILLVADEVQSGIGRTGKWWAIEHTGVQPDIVCMAKGIASGMPLGVTMSRADIMDWVPGSHASTFGGNPVCIAAALATLDVIEKEGLLAELRRSGQPHAEAHGGLATQAQAGGRRARPRVDGRRRNRQGPEDQGVCARKSATASSNWPSSVASCSWAAVPARFASRRPLVVTKDEADVAVDVLEECITLAGVKFCVVAGDLARGF